MRVLLVANKWWECDPALSAMLNNNARPPHSPWPDVLHPSRKVPEQMPYFNHHPVPRAIFGYNHFRAEVWCISDLLDHYSPSDQSSSEIKAELLHHIFDYTEADHTHEQPGLVIALGTACTPIDVQNRNGCVAIGTSIFMHNGRSECPTSTSNLNSPYFDQLLESPVTPEMFAAIAAMDVTSAANRFLPVPTHASAVANISVGLGDVALNTINVTDPAYYAVCDNMTLDAFQSQKRSAQPVSLETTHGLIRIQSNSPFLFISGIVNRFEQFGVDVVPRLNGQNTAGAYNAGVAAAWLLAELDAVPSIFTETF
ncbi:MAG TPA: hypothetical protein VK608_01635 [Edaphobacter sp.]|nr:hypothetical protein [Edaphobacter sp.]